MFFSSTIAFVAVALVSLSGCHAQSAGTMFAMNVGDSRRGRFMAEEFRWLRGGAQNTDPMRAPLPGVMPIYSSNRFGKTSFGSREWGYDIPFRTAGMYTCTAHFGENYARISQAGQRVFDLSFSSGSATPITFANIDVYRESRGTGTRVHTVRTNINISGTLNIRVRKTPASRYGAFISAIACTRNFGTPQVTAFPATAAPATGAPATAAPATATPVTAAPATAAPAPAAPVTIPPEPTSMDVPVVVDPPTMTSPEPAPIPTATPVVIDPPVEPTTTPELAPISPDTSAVVGPSAEPMISPEPMN